MGAQGVRGPRAGGGGAASYLQLPPPSVAAHIAVPGRVRPNRLGQGKNLHRVGARTERVVVVTRPADEWYGSFFRTSRSSIRSPPPSHPLLILLAASFQA